MVATAVKLASKRRRGIHVHSMLTVPTHLPLNAEMPEAEAAAQSKIEEARLIGGQRVTGHVARVRPGQAGYSIAEEAELIKAAAIVVGLRYRGGVPLYDKTLQTVLGERPCRVIVVSDPHRQAGRRPQRRGRGRRGDRPRGSTGGRSRASRWPSSLVGLVVLGVTLANGGGPLSVGVLMGIAFLARRRRPALGRLEDGAVSEPGAPPAGPAGEAAGRPAAEARPRRALAVRRRLLGGRLLDLLRARRRRRPRPRPDAADLPRLRPALRPDHAQLRRGRGDVPRARRLLDLRPPRLQRADRLHRRLGDPDRLPDRDRPGGDLGAALPGADLGQLRQAGAGDRRRRRGDRRGLRAQHLQRHRPRAAALAGVAGPRRPRPAAGGDRRRRRSSSSIPTG